MPSRTIKVTGVSEELLHLLDEQVRARRVAGRSEYIRELIRKDALAPRTFRDLMDPAQAETRRLDESDEETEAFLQGEIQAHRRERRARIPI